MLRKAPSFESVEIFVAAARAESFRSVARDLALSPSAVSRRIAALEEFLGVRLFDRSGPLPALNAAGRRYLELVEPGLRAITDATDGLARPQGDRLRVATSHSFASTWLLPRLPALLDETGIDVELVMAGDLEVLASNQAQLGIWGGRSSGGGLTALRLFDVCAIPVSTERLANGRAAPLGAEDLETFPLVSVRHPHDLWERWLGVQPRDMRTYDTLQMMYEAAAAGLGVALAAPLLSEPFLASGRLRPCWEEARPLGLSYDLFRRSDRGMLRMEKVFIDWLQAKIGESLRTFDAHCGAAGTASPPLSAAASLAAARPAGRTASRSY